MANSEVSSNYTPIRKTVSYETDYKDQKQMLQQKLHDKDIFTLAASMQQAGAYMH